MENIILIKIYGKATNEEWMNINRYYAEYIAAFRQNAKSMGFEIRIAYINTMSFDSVFAEISSNNFLSKEKEEAAAIVKMLTSEIKVAEDGTATVTPSDVKIIYRQITAY